MTKTALLYTPKYLEHDPGRGHPESASRLKVIMNELKKSGILERKEISLLEPKPAELKEIELVHDPEYIQAVRRFCEAGGGLLDIGDTAVSPKSFEAAVLAVGGAIDAVDLVMSGKAENAFALVRPPGHHAGPRYALGFCIFNNVAVAAAHLLHNFNLERILILDIDAHHGNGTQETFYATKKVLYMSLHQDPHGFPDTGFIDETGKGDGLGYTVNVPFPFRVDDRIYMRAFNQIITPIVEQYKPQFILVSVGFDVHHTDPIAGLALSSFGCLEAFGKAMDFASEFCEGKLVAVLEGGYNLALLGKLAAATVAKMAGIPYVLKDERPVATSNVRKRAEKIIEEVKHVQSAFWKL